MKKKSIILSLLFIIFVIVLTPAKLIKLFIPDNSPITIGDVSGNLFSAKISQVISYGYKFNDVKVSPNLLDFLTHNMSFNFDIAKGDVKGNGSLTLKETNNETGKINQLSLKKANLTVAAEKLESFLNINGLKLDGLIKTTDLDLLLENQKPKQTDGKITWSNSSGAFMGTSLELGEFIVKMTTTNNQTIVGELEKSKNELDLQGKFTLSKQGLFEFVGSISSEIDKALYDTIALFSQSKLKNGRLPISYKQQIF